MNKYMYILRGLWLYNNNWNIYYEKKCLYYICKRIYLNIGKKLFGWDKLPDWVKHSNEWLWFCVSVMLFHLIQGHSANSQAVDYNT